MARDSQIGITEPTGELHLESMHASEQLGRLFEYELSLFSKNEAVDIDRILGQNVTVTLELPDGSERFFNGIVSRFSQVGRNTAGFATYEATLRPWLWFLTRTADCRIFQDKTVPDIIKEICKDEGFTDIEDKLSGSYRIWGYCVQYRETDFNFISRLMEQEGIYYYFKHANGKHTLVLGDAIGSHESIGAALPYRPPGGSNRGREASISDWLLTREVTSGAFALNDFDAEKPRASLRARALVKRDHTGADYEIYDYPGEYRESSDGDQYAGVRIEELQTGFEQVSGSSDARNMATGGLFEMAEHPRDDQNREYLLVSMRHELHSEVHASGGNSDAPVYACWFGAIDSRTPYRSPRATPKPMVQGPQTAIVVGKSGEEIWTDKYGRVKVQFHWDRYGKSDENSSCWVRVAQVWAGKEWGAMHIPRVGQEVIVEFLEGDPDQPIITGRVYNEDNKPPYGLAANQTQSGIKSRSTKGGTAENFNEIRFEDKKDAEEIYIHAEKDFTRIVENDDTLKVGFDKKKPGDQTIDIHNNRKTTLAQGSDTLTVKKGDHSIKVSMGKSVIEAMKSIELKVGSNSIKIDQTGVTIKGTMIKIEGQAMVKVKGAMTEVKGDAMVMVSGGLVKVN